MSKGEIIGPALTYFPPTGCVNRNAQQYKSFNWGMKVPRIPKRFHD